MQAKFDFLQTAMADLNIMESASENHFVKDIAVGNGGDDRCIDQYLYLVFYKVLFLSHWSFADLIIIDIKFWEFLYQYSEVCTWRWLMGWWVVI